MEERGSLTIVPEEAEEDLGGSLLVRARALSLSAVTSLQLAVSGVAGVAACSVLDVSGQPFCCMSPPEASISVLVSFDPEDPSNARTNRPEPRTSLVPELGGSSHGQWQ